MKLLAPSHDAEYDPGHYDCTGHIGQLHASRATPEWPMYSFDWPAHILWNSIARELHIAGWSDEKIKTWLQSKDARWALDSDLGEMLMKIGEQFGKKLAVSR